MTDDTNTTEYKMPETVKCGYVTIAGRPNAGKSTLLNNILEQKVSIVTRKPQTTRDRILAVYNSDEAQIVFLDTPGIHIPKDGLGKHMNDTAQNAMSEADVCLWMIDVNDKSRETGLTKAELAIAGQIKDLGIPTVIGVNKVDVMKSKKTLLPLIDELFKLQLADIIVPLSALKGESVDTLLKEIIEKLPTGPRLFPEEMLSDRGNSFFVAELVREAITNITHNEVPYRTAVVIDSFKKLQKGYTIFASIHIETKGQKAIIIGKGGEMLKVIREAATKEAETMLNTKVNLRLHVNVSPNWSTNPAGLKKMGYE
ncbi:MAG: GTPase Era [Deltaproteobacteria bacterium]|nr:GTPase Era [Deltaproteobacteria bacterium]